MRTHLPNTRLLAAALVMVVAFSLTAVMCTLARRQTVTGGQVGNEPRMGKQPTGHSHGSAVSGTVLHGSTPVAGARVCGVRSVSSTTRADLRTRCTSTNAEGHYQLSGLPAGRYLISGMASNYATATHRGPDGSVIEISLEPGEQRDGIDILLNNRGVLMQGQVVDITGGSIAGAEVALECLKGACLSVETDKDGRFSAWVQPGMVIVEAVAEGYVPAESKGVAPGMITIGLLPESSISGTVVDQASGLPAAGLLVYVADGGIPLVRQSYLTGPDGRFTINRLRPGRYAVVARGRGKFGTGFGTKLLGLGQNIADVIVSVGSAARIEGTVVVADSGSAPCSDPDVWLRSTVSRDTLPFANGTNGKVYLDGVPPGTYSIEVNCVGFLSRTEYPLLTVAQQDVSGLVWQVERGAEIRGRVINRSGTPAQHALVSVGFVKATCDSDGNYVLRGLPVGEYTLNVRSSYGIANLPGILIKTTALEFVKDVVLDDAGHAHGTVIDRNGIGVPNAEVIMTSSGGEQVQVVTTDRAGVFAFDLVPVGNYRLEARSGEAKSVSITSTDTEPITLIVNRQQATIRGVVIDHARRGVGDACVIAVPEGVDQAMADYAGSRWVAEYGAVMTASDGAFVVTGLDEGRYTLRAFRRGGGGEAFKHQVPAGSRSVVIAIRPTAAIKGRVNGLVGPSELYINMFSRSTWLQRGEKFFGTAGHYEVRDLPAGTYTITALSGGRRGQLVLDLAEGQERSDGDIDMDVGATVRGQILEAISGDPLSEVDVYVTPDNEFLPEVPLEARGLRGLSDASGQFRVPYVPQGLATVAVVPRSPNLVPVSVVVDVKGPTVDLDEVRVARRE